MHENKVRLKIKEGKMAISASVDLADPALVEIMGIAGFDAVWIDTEHSQYDFKLIEEMIRAADVIGITAIVRVAENNPKTIGRILDMGAGGIYIPHIKGKDDALAAVRAVRYAPLGYRGAYGTSRAARYGSIPWDEHAKTSNSEILIAVMIEDKEVLNEVEDIASIDGLDFISVGPACLSMSLGVPPNDPKLKNVVESVAAAIRRVGKAKMAMFLNHAVLQLNAVQLRDLGVVFAVTGGARYLLYSSLRDQIQTIKTQLS